MFIMQSAGSSTIVLIGALTNMLAGWSYGCTGFSLRQWQVCYPAILADPAQSKFLAGFGRFERDCSARGLFTAESNETRLDFSHHLSDLSNAADETNVVDAMT